MQRFENHSWKKMGGKGDLLFFLNLLMIFSHQMAAVIYHLYISSKQVVLSAHFKLSSGISADLNWFLFMSFQNNLKPPEAKRKIQHVTWPWRKVSKNVNITNCSFSSKFTYIDSIYRDPDYCGIFLRGLKLGWKSLPFPFLFFFFLFKIFAFCALIRKEFLFKQMA